MKIRYFIGITVIAFLCFYPSLSLAKKKEFPLLANYYLLSEMSNSDVEDLANFDLLVLPMETQIYDPQAIADLRELNPDIKILPYVPSQSINLAHMSSIRQKMLNNIDDSWYLRDSGGNKISDWENMYNLNVNSNWNRYLANFVEDELLAKKCKGVKCWDGVFYDMADGKVDFLNDGDIDIDNDGEKDQKKKLNTAWRKGMKKLLKNTRSNIGNKKTIIINGSSYKKYQKHINGRMYENFPTPWIGSGKWPDSMENRKKLKKYKYFGNPTFVFNGDSTQKNYKKMRYGLTSSLLYGSYFSFDKGSDSHKELWLYDEYQTYLGKPLGPAYNILNQKHPKKMQRGVWRRDFENGTILVNSTKKKRKINLETGFEKINGSQAPKINNGQIINKVTLKKRDGVVLLGRLSEIRNAPFLNGSFAKVYDSEGDQKRRSFYTYDSNYGGGVQIIKLSKKTIVASNTYVSIYNSRGQKIEKFAPYGDEYSDGINISLGYLHKKHSRGRTLVVGSKKSGGQIRMYSLSGNLVHPGCFPYGTGFNGGINISTGNVTGGQAEEIVVAPASGGGPHVKILNRNCSDVNPGFMAYDEGSNSGVSVGVGDINGKGKDEIVTGPGEGMSPHVKIFNAKGKVLSPGFFPYSKDNKSGLFITVADIDNNGVYEIITNSYSEFE